MIGQGRSLYTLADGESIRLAGVSGAYAYRAVSTSDYPVTGDFVACRVEQDSWVIEMLLPRRGVLCRKAAGNREEAQLLAANVDMVFLVFAVDGGRGFLPNLEERLLALVRASGAAPVIVLNKADLTENLRSYLEEARASAPDVELLCTSALTGENLQQLRERLAPGRTHFFLGKSGVGKSSLINALFGQEVQRTGEVQEKDRRGRHTTSSRELFRLPGGALLLDSPGLREAGLWVEEQSVVEVFPEIAGLEAECRFRDCRHAEEPGCAVRAALEAGSLEKRRFASYLEFRREARYHQLRGDVNAQRLERLRWKKIAGLRKDLNRDREKYLV